MASPEVLNMADRTKLSNRKLTGNVAALLKSAQKIVLDSEQKNYSRRTKESKLTENDNQTKTKVDLKDFHLSEKTVRRQRNKNREENYKEFVTNFVAPRHAAVHWDGKLCREVLGSNNGVDYVSILVSGYPEMVEGTLIEVADLINTQGETQARAVFDSLCKMKSEKNIRALVFDTTASNTDLIQGAAARLERDQLKCKMCRLGCRHHTHELILKPVWKLLFGDNEEFKNFKTTSGILWIS